MSSHTSKPLARVRLHPFVVVMGAMALASIGHELWPISPAWAVAPLLRNVGKALGLGGVVILVFAYGAMARSRTTINPRRHTAAVVTSGVYGFSRNPIYLGWFLFLFGAGLERLSLFSVVVSIVMILLLHGAVVLPEEKYLEDTFSEEYLSYKRRVRRWL